jgi:hydroxypyruvate isomerase
MKNMNGKELNRRAALACMAGASTAVLATGQAAAQEEKKVLKGRIKQSVSKWCFGKIPMDAFCKEAKAMGLVGVDLLSEGDWSAVLDAGLLPTMANGPGGIKVGWNDPKNHEELIAKSEELLPKVAEAGLPNMIVFSGNRNGMPDKEGLRNCARGLRNILPLAEQLGVVVHMELLNSKRSHEDYMCDHTAWGAELCEKLGTDSFKLLYDIFHMQIMEGDVIDTLRENIQYIGHIHTGGVPGRHEIDGSQELNYKRICEAIAELDFKGYVAHEFVPAAKDPLNSLREAVALCDV